MAITGSTPSHTVTSIYLLHAVTHSWWTVCLSVCSDFLAMPLVLLPLFLLPLLFGFLPLCCSYIQTARSHWISKSEFFKCFALPLGWVVGDEWIMNLKGYGWKRLCPNVVIRWQAELEEFETTKDNRLECVQDDSRADIQVRYVPVNLLYREVAQFPLYCSFTWQHCALVNYMLLCVDLTWSQHGTGITLQNMCHNINIIVTRVTVTAVRCTRTVYSVEQ